MNFDTIHLSSLKSKNNESPNKPLIAKTATDSLKDENEYLISDLQSGDALVLPQNFHDNQQGKPLTEEDESSSAPIFEETAPTISDLEHATELADPESKYEPADEEEISFPTSNKFPFTKLFLALGPLLLVSSLVITLILLNNTVVPKNPETYVLTSPGLFTNISGCVVGDRQPGSDLSCHRGLYDTEYCDLPNGTCSYSAASVYRYVCDGKQTDCRSNETVGSTQEVGAPGCGKTVQIDVFDTPCRDSSGNWICGERSPLDYFVWYTGDCSQIVCNNVILSVQPNPTQINNQVTLRISGDGSTYQQDTFGPGLDCSGNEWNWTIGPGGDEDDYATRTCRTTQSGTYTWSLNWRHCVGDTNLSNCSDICSASTQYTITPPPLSCSAITSTNPTPTREQSITYSCTASNSTAIYANFRVLKDDGSPVTGAEQLNVPMDTANKAAWTYQIPATATEGQYIVQCQVCNISNQCTQWGQTQ